jgi:hypothetical protein
VATTINSAASALLQEQINNTPKTPLGRPTTVAKAANIPKVGLNAKPIGRPVGQAARIEEFKAFLMGDNGPVLMSKLVTIALNDTHPGQMGALKMCIDRVLPLSHFDKTTNGGQSPTISINITGLTNSTVSAVGSQGGLFASDDITDIESRGE